MVRKFPLTTPIENPGMPDGAISKRLETQCEPLELDGKCNCQYCEELILVHTKNNPNCKCKFCRKFCRKLYNYKMLQQLAPWNGQYPSPATQSTPAYTDWTGMTSVSTPCPQSNSRPDPVYAAATFIQQQPPVQQNCFANNCNFSSYSPTNISNCSTSVASILTSPTYLVMETGIGSPIEPTSLVPVGSLTGTIFGNCKVPDDCTSIHSNISRADSDLMNMSTYFEEIRYSSSGACAESDLDLRNMIYVYLKETLTTCS